MPRLFERKFALADPAAQTIGEGSCRFFTIGGDKFRERGEQTNICPIRVGVIAKIWF